MKTITLTGAFSNVNPIEQSLLKTNRNTEHSLVNSSVLIEVFRLSPLPYDLKKKYSKNFSDPLSDMENDTEYTIIVSGYTVGKFHLTIGGEFIGTNPIELEVSNAGFTQLYSIKTNP